MSETNEQPSGSPLTSPSCAPQELGNGVYYGGRGPGGEYYSAEVDDLSSESLWVTQAGQNVWTLERLKLVVAHMEANTDYPHQK